MENRNIKKASAIYRWTMKKYRSITIAYGVLLILSLPVVELLSILSAYSMSWNEDLNTYVNVVTEMEIKPLMVLPIMVAVIFSSILSFIGFSYMHNKRCVDFFGSLPVSRRTLFFARYLAVITLMVLPFLVTGIIGGGLTFSVDGFQDIMEYTLISSLVIIANITLIAFISLCCGTNVDVVIAYLALNAAYPVLIAILNAFPMTIIPGIAYGLFPACVFTFFCPIAASYTGIFGGGYLLHCIWWIAITAVLLAGCYLLCKKRKAETAQNSFTFSVLSVVIKFIVCFAAGFGLGWIFSFIGSAGDNVVLEYVWFGIGAVMGIMVANILLHLIFYKGLKHYGKSLIECGVVACVVAGFVLAVNTGLFGYDTYLPKADEVTEVFISDFSNEFYIDGVNILENYSEKKEDIDAVIAYHKGVIAQCRNLKKHGLYPLVDIGNEWTDYEGKAPSYVKIIYLLNNGRKVEREYYVEALHSVKTDFPEKLCETLKHNKSFMKMLSTKYMDPWVYIDQISNQTIGSSTSSDLTKAQCEKLLAALHEDFKDHGSYEQITLDYEMSERQFDKNDKYVLSFNFSSSVMNSLSVEWRVTQKDTKTLAVLKELGLSNLDYLEMRNFLEDNFRYAEASGTQESIYFSMPEEWDAQAPVYAISWNPQREEIYGRLQGSREKCERVSDAVWKYELPAADKADRVMFYQVLEEKVNCTGRIKLPADKSKNLLKTTKKYKNRSVSSSFPNALYKTEWTKFH